MSPPSHSLPHPTTIIASLLTHLSTLPPASPQTTSPHSHLYPQDGPPSLSKPHLLTLHALFPTTLLPALDLLDRRLITRFEILDTHPGGAAAHTTASDAANIVPRALELAGAGDFETERAQREPPAEGAASAPPQPQSQPKIKRNPLYYVRSSNAPSSSSSRYSHSHHSSRPPGPRQQGLEDGKSYEVRTQAWSCSCAAFAFAAFHYGGGRGGEGEDEGGGAGDDGATEDEDGDDDEGMSHEERDGKRERERVKWGGLMAVYGKSRSGRRHGGGQRLPLPLCKHLLACVLAEWWREAEDMVERKTVGSNELAGWAAGWGG